MMQYEYLISLRNHPAWRLFRLLRDIVRDSSTDPDERIMELESQKAAIEAEIARLREYRLPPRDGTRIREQYLQAGETARGLLFDFRQIEENFRKLDRNTRQRIATSELPKGKLLDEIFDQGGCHQGLGPGEKLSGVLDLSDVARQSAGAGPAAGSGVEFGRASGYGFGGWAGPDSLPAPGGGRKGK